MHILTHHSPTKGQTAGWVCTLPCKGPARGNLAWSALLLPHRGQLRLELAPGRASAAGSWWEVCGEGSREAVTVWACAMC